MENLSPEYWNNRYKHDTATWDLRSISPPIKAYIDQLEDKTISILIPGCGLGYEGEYLFKQGFFNVHLLDFAKEPLEAFQKRNPHFAKEHLHRNDFFKHEGQYDLILEQTLFCAIDPSLREAYVNKIVELLTTKGKLVGLFFNRTFEGGPPFGGSKEEYLSYFSSFFSTIYMEECYNSANPRLGSELFIQIQGKILDLYNTK